MNAPSTASSTLGFGAEGIDQDRGGGGPGRVRQDSAAADDEPVVLEIECLPGEEPAGMLVHELIDVQLDRLPGDEN